MSRNDSDVTGETQEEFRDRLIDVLGDIQDAVSRIDTSNDWDEKLVDAVSDGHAESVKKLDDIGTEIANVASELNKQNEASGRRRPEAELPAFARQDWQRIEESIANYNNHDVSLAKVLADLSATGSADISRLDKRLVARLAYNHPTCPEKEDGSGSPSNVNCFLKCEMRVFASTECYEAHCKDAEQCNRDENGSHIKDAYNDFTASKEAFCKNLNLCDSCFCSDMGIVVGDNRLIRDAFFKDFSALLDRVSSFHARIEAAAYFLWTTDYRRDDRRKVPNTILDALHTLIDPIRRSAKDSSVEEVSTKINRVIGSVRKMIDALVICMDTNYKDVMKSLRVTVVEETLVPVNVVDEAEVDNGSKKRKHN